MKLLPTYPLEEVKQLFHHHHYVTQQALQDAFALGLDEKDIEQIISKELSPEHFFKTMPAKKKPGLWQDVYKIEYLGMAIYLKLQLGPRATSVVVISCKQDESRCPEVR